MFCEHYLIREEADWSRHEDVLYALIDGPAS
jgi:hypothetical protein